MKQHCLVFIGATSRLREAIEESYRKAISAKSSDLIIYIVTNCSIREVIPQVRDIFLHNIVFGITMYLFSYGEVEKMFNEMERVIDKENSKIIVYVTKDRKEIADMVLQTLKETNMEVEEVKVL
ncbi:MAG: hypothetical protein J7J99_00725 [Thermoprotei archaeon]|nr:hypothetical protein [Thermoprotei archaeon]